MSGLLKPLGFDYRVNLEDMVDRLSFGTAVFLCTRSFGVQVMRSRYFAKRFRLARRYGNRAKRGFILSTAALKRLPYCSV